MGGCKSLCSSKEKEPEIEPEAKLESTQRPQLSYAGRVESIIQAKSAYDRRFHGAQGTTKGTTRAAMLSVLNADSERGNERKGSPAAEKPNHRGKRSAEERGPTITSIRHEFGNKNNGYTSMGEEAKFHDITSIKAKAITCFRTGDGSIHCHDGACSAGCARKPGVGGGNVGKSYGMKNSIGEVQQRQPKSYGSYPTEVQQPRRAANYGSPPEGQSCGRGGPVKAYNSGGFKFEPQYTGQEDKPRRPNAELGQNAFASGQQGPRKQPTNAAAFAPSRQTGGRGGCVPERPQRKGPLEPQSYGGGKPAVPHNTCSDVYEPARGKCNVEERKRNTNSPQGQNEHAEVKPRPRQKPVNEYALPTRSQKPKKILPHALTKSYNEGQTVGCVSGNLSYVHPITSSGGMRTDDDIVGANPLQRCCFPMRSDRKEMRNAAAAWNEGGPARNDGAPLVNDPSYTTRAMPTKTSMCTAISRER